jgi:Glyoxalase superfamily protein
VQSGQSHTLRAAFAAIGFKITVGQSLELISQSFGVADWNTLSTTIRPWTGRCAGAVLLVLR